MQDTQDGQNPCDAIKLGLKEFCTPPHSINQILNHSFILMENLY